MRGLRNVLRQTIFVRIILMYILGVLLYFIFQESYLVLYIFYLSVITVGLCVMYGVIFMNIKKITFNFFNGLIVYIVCILFGYINSYVTQENQQLKYLEILRSPEAEILIISDGQVKKSICIYEGKLLYHGENTGNVSLLYKGNIPDLKYGDLIKVKNKLERIPDSRNPGEFNFKNYKRTKHTYHQIFIDKNEIKSRTPNQASFFHQFSYRCKQKLLNILKSNIRDEEVFNMSAALLLGERTDLDKDLLKSYSDTGTIHIISVSGLHVGIIFVVLQWIILRIGIFKNIFLQTFVLLAFIWMYAVLTGLPPSVNRSATMISFNIIGKAVSIRSNSFNLISASALLLLSIDPILIFDIGFQLSYLAVIGIIYMQKSISNFWFPSNYIVKNIWMIVAVSISAQIFTLPLCLLYFHQFPNYFILAKIIAIPLSTVALYAGIAALLFSKIPYLNTAIEYILIYSIQLMNWFLKWISTLPFSVTEGLFISGYEALILSMLLFSCVLYFKERLKKSVFLLFFCLIFITTKWIYDTRQPKQNYLWVCHSSKSPILTLQNGDELIHYFPSNLTTELINKYLNTWKNTGLKVSKVYMLDVNKNQYELKFNKYSVAVILNNKGLSELNVNDYLVGNFSKKTMEKLSNKTSKQVITNRKLQISTSMDKYYSTYESGSLQLPL